MENKHPQPLTSYMIAYLVLIFIQVLFGINFAVSKNLVGIFDHIHWAFYRFLIAGVIMGSVTIAMRRPHPKPTRQFFIPLILFSMFGMALGQAFFLYGLKYTTSVNASILTSLIPVTTLILLVIKRVQKLDWNILIGILVSFIGVLVIRNFENLSLSDETIYGDISILCAVICFSLFIALSQKFIRNYDSLWVTTWMFFISSIFLFFISPQGLFSYSSGLWLNSLWLIIYAIVGSTVLTFYLNNWVMQRVNPIYVALYIYFQPVIAVLIGYFYLGEEVGMRTIFSVVLIFTGVLITKIPKKAA